MEKEEFEKRENWKQLNNQEKKEKICQTNKKEELKRLAGVKRASWRIWRKPEKQIPPSSAKRKRDQSDGLQPAKPRKRIKEGTHRGPSKNNTHLEGPNPTADLKLESGPANWGTCELKDAFRIKMTQVKKNKLFEIKEESTWWNRSNTRKEKEKGEGGGGSGWLAGVGSPAPTDPKAPKNHKRSEKLAGERGGTPPPMYNKCYPQSVRNKIH